MKTPALLFVVLPTLVMVGASPARGAEEPAAVRKLQPVAVEPVRFLGYMGTKEDPWFFLETKNAQGEADVQRAKLGGAVRGYRLTRFDAKDDNLGVKNASRQEIILHLVDGAKTAEAKVPAMTAAEARTFAFDLANAELANARRAQPDLRVEVDPDLASMAPAQRERFLAARARLQTTGQLLTAFRLSDGRWGQAISSDMAKRLPPTVLEHLGDEDRARFNQLFAHARAEEIARNIPPKSAPAR